MLHTKMPYQFVLARAIMLSLPLQPKSGDITVAGRLSLDLPN